MAERKGFAHCCPNCGEADSLKLNVADATYLECPECDAELSVADLEEIAQQLHKLIAFVKSVPSYEDGVIALSS